MTWRDHFPRESDWSIGIVGYAQERIAEHTKTCLSRTESEANIRAAQAAIEELEYLLGVPKLLKRAGEQQQRPGRKEY